MLLQMRKAQSVLEYSLVIAAVIGGILVMQHYVRRAYQGRIQEGSNEIGKQFDSPDAYTFAWQNKGSGQTQTNETAAGGITTNDTTVSEIITSDEKETWGANDVGAAKPTFTW